MTCPGLGLHLLPLSVFILLPATFITTYTISVLLGHVEPGFPYISDTGTHSPESCIFGQLLNICAVLIGLTIYVRYEQIKEYNQDRRTMMRLNKVALVLGFICAAGISLVGNFQETNVIVVHLIGAIMAFGVGAIYCWIQTYMSYHMVPHMNSRSIFIVRFIVCFVFTTAFVLMFIGAVCAFNERKTLADFTKWKVEDIGYDWHLVSTASEWIMAIVVLIFFTTFMREFKQLSMTLPTIGYVWHLVSTASEWIMAVAVLVFFTTFVREFKQLSMTPPKIHFPNSRQSPSSYQQGYGSIDDIVT